MNEIDEQDTKEYAERHSTDYTKVHKKVVEKLNPSQKEYYERVQEELEDPNYAKKR